MQMTPRDGCGRPVAQHAGQGEIVATGRGESSPPPREPSLPADRRTAGRQPGGRGEYLIRGGTVVSVDPDVGILPRGDVHVRDGEIVDVGAELTAAGAEIIDASRMIVMPG